MSRITLALLTFAAGVVLAGLAGCETAMSSDDDRLTQQDWVAQAIGGKQVINAGRVTLSFAEGRISGRGGCNLYSGPAEYGNGTIKVGTLISTKMACAETGVMAQENEYLNALRSAERYRFLADGRLTIATKSGELIYDGAPRQMRPEG